MFSFKQYLDAQDSMNEAKLSYDQQYDVHLNEIGELKNAGYEVWASDTEMKNKPGHSSYGYQKRYGMRSPRFETREMKLQISFAHNKFTRVNSEVVSKLVFTDGDNEYTGSGKIIDEKKHKNIKAAIKYLEKLGLEKMQESLSYLLLAFNGRSIENLKKDYILHNIYTYSRFTGVKDANSAEKFALKVQKANLDNLTKANAYAKKLIKKI